MIFLGIIIILLLITLATGIQYLISNNTTYIPASGTKKSRSTYQALIVSKEIPKTIMEKFIKKTPDKSKRLIFSTTNIPFNQFSTLFDQNKIFIPENEIFQENCGYELKQIPNSNIIVILANQISMKSSYCSHQLNSDLKIAQNNSRVVYIILPEKIGNDIWKKINEKFKPIIRGIFITHSDSNLSNISHWGEGSSWKIGIPLYSEFPLNSPIELSMSNIL